MRLSGWHQELAALDQPNQQRGPSGSSGSGSLTMVASEKKRRRMARVNPLGRRLVDVGEQPQRGIELAEPLQLLRPLQATVAQHAAHQRSSSSFMNAVSLSTSRPRSGIGISVCSSSSAERTINPSRLGKGTHSLQPLASSVSTSVHRNGPSIRPPQ